MCFVLNYLFDELFARLEEDLEMETRRNSIET
jgi:hypothetical protein